ncbi:MAG: hypothetical protein ABI980_16000 [Nitrospirota bacterium]
MKQLVHRTVPATIGVMLLGAVVLWGSQSLPTPSVSSAVAPSPSAMITTSATPSATGFADVAKAVTPAVVNITTVTLEKVVDGRSTPEALRDRMEEFFGGPGNPSVPVGSMDHRGQVSHGAIEAEDSGPGSSSHRMAMF